MSIYRDGKASAISTTTSVFSLLAAAALGLTACSRSSSRPSFSLPQSPLLASLERKVGLITYVGGDGNVYVVDQTGKNPTPITTDAQIKQGDFNIYEFPTWSRDAQSIAFYGQKGSTQADVTASVYTSDAAGKSVKAAFSTDRHVPIYLAWSPDSSKIAFISQLKGSNNIVFNLLPATGGEAQVADIGAPFYWDWLPDGSGVMVHAGGSGSQSSEERLSLLTLTDGVVEDTLAVKPGLFHSPALSPDGSQALMAIADSSGKDSLVVTDRLGKVASTVTALDGPVAFAWSPDGKRVAYLTGPTGAGPVLGKISFAEFDVDGKVKIGEAAEDNVVAFFWAPDSKQVAYFVLAQAAAPTPAPGATPSGGAGGSTSGYYLKLYVADAASGTGKLVVPAFSPSDDFWRTIPYFDQYARSGTLWSPDSQYLVLNAFAPDNNPGIFVVPASGVTAPRFLLDGSMPFWSPK